MTCSQCKRERVVILELTIVVRGKDQALALCVSCARRGGWLEVAK
jgi:protein-arginine kinase activator protein McsA